jgi:hypothetical protein
MINAKREPFFIQNSIQGELTLPTMLPENGTTGTLRDPRQVAVPSGGGSVSFLIQLKRRSSNVPMRGPNAGGGW